MSAPVVILEADWSRTYGADDIDQFLLEAPPAPETAPRRRDVPYIGPERPGDAFNAVTDAGDLLLAAGWTLYRQPDRNGDRHFTRPGKERRDGSSATVYANDGHCYMFSDGDPTVPKRWYDPFGLYAHLYHGGQFAPARAALAAQGYGTRSVDLTWLPPIELTDRAPEQRPAEPVNIRWVHDITTNPSPEPPVLIDGFMRQGELLVVGAPRAIGKSWLAMNIATVLARGEGKLFGHLPVRRGARVLLCQGELDEWGSEQRWLKLTGLTAGLPEVAETFDRRIRIRTTKKRTTQTIDGVTMTDEYVDAELSPLLEQLIIEHGFEVVIIDPWATYYSGNESSNDEVEAALDKLRGLTLSRGVSWVIFHHIRKASEASEPEDLWRGASRLADWASTRVTVMPHYSERKRVERGMTRRVARTFVDVFMLRRSDPTEDFSLHRGDDGWWRVWEPDEAEEALDNHGGTTDKGGRPPAKSMREFLNELATNRGRWASVSEAGDHLGISRSMAGRIADHAEAAGLIRYEAGARNTKHIVITDLGREKADRFVSSPELSTAARTAAQPELQQPSETPARLDNTRSDHDSELRETSAVRNLCAAEKDQVRAPVTAARNPPTYVGVPDPDGPPPNDTDSSSIDATTEQPVDPFEGLL